jgi:hypothetical protein
MDQSTVKRPVLERHTDFPNVGGKDEAYGPGVSWPAVIAGAFVAAALSLILLSLGTGLGFSAISPWSNVGMSASTVGRAAIVWLIVTEIIASAMGGYLAGRLRTKWVNVHTDEVYFRDTAHGFLVWAVGLVVTASFLASAAASLAGTGGGQAGNGTSEAAGMSVATASPSSYLMDTLFRTATSNSERTDAPEVAQADRIFVRSLHQGSMSGADQAYLAQLVSARTGLSQSDAAKRVSDVFAEARESADRARKALAHLSLWLFVALLIGAFSASFAGTIGGRQRDHVTL